MTFARYYDAPQLPLFSRVLMYALDHDGQRLDRAELHDAVDPFRLIRSAEISRAIRHCVRKGLLAPGSSCSALYVAHDEGASITVDVPGGEKGTHSVSTPDGEEGVHSVYTPGDEEGMHVLHTPDVQATLSVDIPAGQARRTAWGAA
jgi:hypothetical protein